GGLGRRAGPGRQPHTRPNSVRWFWQRPMAAGTPGLFGQRAAASMRARRGWGWLSLPAALFLILPLAALLLRVRPEQLWASLGQPEVYRAAALSAATTVWTTLLTVLFGTP